jgi:hypothetical protein
MTRSRKYETRRTSPIELYVDPLENYPYQCDLNT